LVGYIEKGAHHNERWDKTKSLVTLRFEVSGVKWPAKEFNGVKEAVIINVNLNLSTHEKAGFSKLFKRMNHTGEYTHMAQMLGKPFIGQIVHKTVGEKVYANLSDDGGFTIRPPFVEDMDTGVSKPVEVAPALSPIQCFIWEHATQEMWDSIFVDGEYPAKTDDEGRVIKAARSKNFNQNMIRYALNFAGSPIDNLLSAGGQVEVAADTPPTRSSGDPLEGL
jgi:hypothetical protein